MSDTEKEVVQPSLADKIRKFFGLNTELKALEKKVDPLSTDIKAGLSGEVEGLIIDEKSRTLVVDDLEAKLSYQARTSLNQERLLAKLKKMKRKDLIKKIEVPDQEKIETLIYNGELDANLLEDCVDTKTVKVLTVKTIKRKASDE